MKQFYQTLILIVLLFLAHGSCATAGGSGGAGGLGIDSYAEVGAPGDLSAAITGVVPFCEGSTGAIVVFEGSGGTAPYTFTYQVDGGAERTIATTSLSSSVDVPVNTTLAKELVFRITSVRGATGKTTAVDITRVVTILPAPVVDFSFSGTSCSDDMVQFNPTIQGAGGYTYLWDFGDGQTSTDQNPVHPFNSTGCGPAAFTVSLTVTDLNGCSTTRSRQVSILQKPDISFSDLNFPFGDPFNNCGSASANSPDYSIRVGNSSLSAGCVNSYTIDWGDGSAPFVHAVFPASHTYTRLGSFEMVITAEGANGCSNDIAYVVKNMNNPSVGITSPGTTTNLCAPTAPLMFEIAKWGTNPPGTLYTVDYGDGTPIQTLTQEQLTASPYYAAANPAASANYPIPHSYTLPNCPNGPYMIRLIATNACSSTEATVNNITVFNKTTPDFTAPARTCVNTSITFVNTSQPGYNPSCNQTSIYTWDFGDGSTLEVTSPTLPKNTSHTYTVPGQYVVKLSSRNICGESSKTQLITIDPPVTASITASGMVSGAVTVCQDASRPVITFTGSNGIAPYTFTYRINNGPLQTVTTKDGSNSVTVEVPTGTPGSFTYTLVNVSEGSPSPCTQVQTGSVTVVVDAPPTGTISGNGQGCLNGPSPQITFTGSGGTRPYIFTYNVNGGPSQTIQTDGNANSVTLSVPTTVAGTFRYYLTGVQDAGPATCIRTISASMAGVTISQPPAPMTLPDEEYCNGENAPGITFTNTVAGTTYRWSNNNTSIGLAATGRGNIPAFTARNNTTAPVTAIITVTPSVNGCEGASQTFTITVDPSAVQFSQGAQTICSGDNTEEVRLTSPAGAALSWSVSVPAGITGVVASGTNILPVQTLINTTGSPLTVTYTATAALPATDPCAGSSYSYAITVNPTPDIQQAFNMEVCSTQAFTVSPQVNANNKIPSGTRYTWSAPVIAPAGTVTGTGAQAIPQTHISQTLINTTSAPATATYSVIPTVNGCAGDPFTIVVTVLPLPKATVTGTVTLCQNEPMPSVTFTGSNGTAPYTFTYRINSGANRTITTTSGNSTSVQVSTELAETITYSLVSVQDAKACVQGQSGSAVITVQPQPDAVITGDATVCANSPSPLITFAGSGGTRPYTFTYTINGGEERSITTDAASSSATVVVPTLTVGTFTYQLTGVKGTGANACIRPVSGSAMVTVKALPATILLSDYEYCNGAVTDVIPFTNTVAGTTYRWSSSNPSIGLAGSGTGPVPSFTAVNATSSPITSTLTVIPSVTGCDGAHQTFTITVYPSPEVTFSTGNQTICSGEKTTAVTLNSSTSGARFNWIADAPAGITGVMASGTNTIPVQVLVNTTSTPLTVTYRAWATTSGAIACPGSEYNYTITVNPKAELREVLSTTICSGSSFSVSPQENMLNWLPAGTSYSWSAPLISPTGSLTGASAQATPQARISQTLINTTSAPATATYSVIPTVNGCAGDPFTIVVTVIPLPTVNPVNDRTLCHLETSAQILFTGNVAGTVYHWTSDNPSIGITDSGTDRIGIFTAMNTGSSPALSRITVTPVFTEGNIRCQGTPVVFTITVNPPAKMDRVEDQRACSGTPLSISFNTSIIEGTTTYEWINSNPAIGLSASGNGNLSFVPVNTGSSSVRATITVTPVFLNNGISCKGTSEIFDIIVDPQASVEKPLDQVVCNGSMTDAVLFTGNTTGAVNQWATDHASVGMPDGGTGSIPPFKAVNNGTEPVVATITVTPVVGGCNGTPVRFTITVNPSPVIITQPAGSVVCLGEKPAALTVVVKGTGIPSYQWYSNTTAGTEGAVSIPNATGASYDPPSAATGTVYYFCRITFPNKDCNLLISDIAQVTINPNPVISALDQEISSGEIFTVIPTWDNGNIVPPGTVYVWADPVISPVGAVTGASAQHIPQAVISQRLVNTTPQSATVTYTVFPVSGACSGASFKVTVVVDSPLTPIVSVTPADCYGVNNGSITTTIQGGSPFAGGTPYVIQWTGPNGYTSDEASIYNLAPGVYHLTITDSRGKVFSADYTIAAPQELIVATDEKRDVSCYGAADGRIFVTVSGGTGPYQTIWTKDRAPFATAEDIAGLAPGSYVLTVTDARNCASKVLSYDIAQPEPLTLSLTGKSDIKCYGDSTGYILVEVTGGVMMETSPGVYGYHFQWTGPGGFTSSAANLRHLPAGDYQLQVTDGAGCTRSLAVTLNVPSALVVEAATTPISCYGANNGTIRLDITGGTPPYRAEWDNYATGIYQDNLSAGDYTILVADANQCQLFTTVNIPEAPVFRINPEVKNVSCYGAKNGSISLNFETTLKSVILTWSDNSRSGTTRNNMGPGTYTVYIEQGDLCMINRTFIITEPLPLELSGAVTDITDCNRVDGGAIDLMVTGGTPPYHYTWSNGAVSEDMNNLQAGNYAITVTDSMGCVKVAQFAVKRPVALAIDVNTMVDQDCATGELKAIATAYVTGGVAPYQLSWSAGNVSGPYNEQMETRQSGLVLLTVTDQTGCTATRSVSIQIPDTGISSQLMDCNTNTFLFNGAPAIASENITYLWEFGDGTTSALQNPQHVYATAGTYKVRLTVAGAGPCVSVYEEMVSAALPPAVAIDKDPRFCPGDSILIYGTGAATYRWNDGSTGDSIWIKAEGDYRVTGTSASGCSATYDFKASYYDLIGYTIHSDQQEISSAANRIRLWSENIPFSGYRWDFGDGHTGQGAEVYHSYEITEDGYFDVTLTVINPNGCEERATKRIWKSANAIVNTFTPNSDGINDIYLKGWQIEVFNRNGILLYKGDQGWDGKHNGRLVDNDTYFVIIYDSTQMGAQYKKTYVTVLR